VRIFVSYRRSDVGGYAGRLHDVLVDRLGPAGVFFDVTAIDAGRDFADEIDEALAGSDAVLAVIGPGWLTAAGPDGVQRLSKPDDFVRTELGRALAANIRVVPVLVGGATLPVAAALPADLAELVDRQAVTIHDEAFRRDVDDLLRALRGKPAGQPGDNRRRWRYAAAAGGVLVVAIVATLLLVNRDAGDNNDDTGLTGCPTPSQPEWTRIELAGSPSAVVPDTDGTVVITVMSASWRPSADGKWEVQLATQMDNENTVAREHGAWFYRDLEVARRPFDPWCFNTLRDTYPDPGLIADGLIGFEVSCAPVGSMDLALTSPVSDERIDLHLTASDEPTACLDSVE
jgi:hypothetical protein